MGAGTGSPGLPLRRREISDLNENTQFLIRSVADNDLKRAKVYAKKLLEADKSQKSQSFVRMAMDRLTSPALNLIELPHSIKGMLIIENVSMSFNPERYVLAEADKAAVDGALNVWKTNSQLQEYGIRYLNSTLLHGDSGCGKTMLGRYIAYKAELPFAYLNFSRVVTSYLGKTGSNISDVFDHVAKLNCVFMLDEIDAIGLTRGSEDVGEMSRIVITLMQCLDAIDNGNIIIGATNRIDILDKALVRRFAMQHPINLPTDDVRKQIAENYFRTIPGASYTQAELELFAENTHGYTCAKIVNLIVSGIVRCLVDGRDINMTEMLTK